MKHSPQFYNIIINLMPTSSRASVLSTNTNAPPVTKTTMGTNLLHPFNIITKLGIKVLRKDLRILSRLEILLSVQEPKWDLELTRILNDSNELLNFISGQLSSTFVDIDFCFLADKIGETATEALNFCEAKDNVPLALDVGVEDTQDVLELVPLHHRHTPVKFQKK